MINFFKAVGMAITAAFSAFTGVLSNQTTNTPPVNNQVIGEVRAIDLNESVDAEISVKTSENIPSNNVNSNKKFETQVQEILETKAKNEEKNKTVTLQNTNTTEVEEAQKLVDQLMRERSEEALKTTQQAEKARLEAVEQNLNLKRFPLLQKLAEIKQKASRESVGSLTTGTSEVGEGNALRILGTANQQISSINSEIRRIETEAGAPLSTPTPLFTALMDNSLTCNVVNNAVLCVTNL